MQIPRLQKIDGKARIELIVDTITRWANGVSDALSGLTLPATIAGSPIPGNVDAWPFELTFTKSGVDMTVGHKLGRVPAGFILTSIRPLASNNSRANGLVSITDGESAATASSFSLRAQFSAPVERVRVSGFVFPAPGGRR